MEIRLGNGRFEPVSLGKVGIFGWLSNSAFRFMDLTREERKERNEMVRSLQYSIRNEG